MILFVAYPKCSTCVKARKFLEEHNVDFTFRDIKENHPNVQEIQQWHELSGIDIQKFFNTSGLVYKNLGLKDRLKTMSLQEKYNLLASDGMLIKRPLVITHDKVIIGYKEDVYQKEIV